jgi:hypothetical protein
MAWQFLIESHAAGKRGMKVHRVSPVLCQTTAMFVRFIPSCRHFPASADNFCHARIVGSTIDRVSPLMP